MPAEATFQDAQRWWKKMRQPVTFTGVPGHPWNPAVLWSAGVLFCPTPNIFMPDGPKFAGPPGLMRELAGHETDALQIEFSFGPNFALPDRMNNTGGHFEQSLLEGRLPIIVSKTVRDGLEWTCTVFSRLADGYEARRGDEVLFTEVRWIARNPSRKARRAMLSAHLNAPHVQVGYKVAQNEKVGPYARTLKWRAPLLTDDCEHARLAAVAEHGDIAFHVSLPPEQRKRRPALAEWGLARDVLVFTAAVPARGETSVRLLIPFHSTTPTALAAALRKPYAAALSSTRSYWRRQLDTIGRVQTPELLLNECFDAWTYHAMIATGRRPRERQWVVKCSPNHYEGLWCAHSAIAAHSLDLRGQHQWSRRAFDGFLANQCPVPRSMTQMWGDKQFAATEGFTLHPGFLGNIEGHMSIMWAFYHGWVMWAMGQHVRLSGDWGWFRRHVDQFVLACEWTAEQRRRSMVKDGRGRRALSWGLLPAGNAFDWGFGHMFWSDAHTWRGLNEIAECLRRIGHRTAGRYLREVEEYRQDIVSSVTRSRDASAPVPLNNGSSIPFVPMSVEMRDYFAPDWTYIACGPLNLAWAGVVPADHELIDQTLTFLHAGRPLGKWLKDQQKYQGWDRGSYAAADLEFFPATRPKPRPGARVRFWRHQMTYEPGWIPQAFTFMYRDELPALIEHFYSLVSNGGQHVEVRTPIESRDGVPWTQPGDANLMRLLRDMLVREQGDELILCGTCPRASLRDGQSLGVTDMPTEFGKVTYKLRSATARGRVTGTFDFHWNKASARSGPPRAVRLRLRHPIGSLPAVVRIDDKVVPQARASEWIDLPAKCTRLEVRYAH